MNKILLAACIFFSLNACNNTSENKSETKSDSTKTFHLGGSSQITIGTTDLIKSQEFYELLGFKKVEDIPNGIQMSDESVLILLQKSDKKILRLSYFDADADKIANAVEQKGFHFVVKNENTGFITRSIFNGPDSIQFSLVKLDAANIYKPKKKMIGISQDGLKDVKNYPNPCCGVFGEFSFPVVNVDSSISQLKKLGFSGDKMTMPYPWAMMSDSLLAIGLHQQTIWKYPALTFFAPDMKEKIEKLKAKGLVFTDFPGMGGGPGNQVLISPEGVHIFLFSWM